MEKVNFEFNNKKKPFFNKNKNGTPEEGKKPTEPKFLKHLPTGSCMKTWKAERSVIRNKKSNKYRKDISVPFNGYGGVNADKFHTEKKGEYKVPPVNQIWSEMLQVMSGSKPKKRIRNIRMPEPKPTGKRR